MSNKKQSEIKPVVKKSYRNNFRYFEFSVSSAALYRRWFGWESLSHQPGALITTRLDFDSVPFLFNHDKTVILGKVIHHRITENSLTVTVKCSRNPGVQYILDDIEDGIRNNFSIGYRVVEMLPCMGADGAAVIQDGEQVFITSKWELTEISSVAVPADYSVGFDKNKTLPALTKLSDIPVNFGLFGLIDEATLKQKYNIYTDPLNPDYFEDLVKRGKIRFSTRNGTRVFVEADVIKHFFKYKEYNLVTIGDLER